MTTAPSGSLLERRLTSAFDRLAVLPAERANVATVAADVGFRRRRFGETPGAIRGFGIVSTVPLAACDPALSLPDLAGGELS